MCAFYNLIYISAVPVRWARVHLNTALSLHCQKRVGANRRSTCRSAGQSHARARMLHEIWHLRQAGWCEHCHYVRRKT